MGKDQILNEKQRSIIPIAAFTATGNLEKLKLSIAEGLEGGLTVNEIKEIIVHLYAYAGFPRCLNGLNTCIEVIDDRRARGIKDNEGREAGPVPAGGRIPHTEEHVAVRVGTSMGQPNIGPHDEAVRDCIDLVAKEVGIVVDPPTLGGEGAAAHGHGLSRSVRQWVVDDDDVSRLSASGDGEVGYRRGLSKPEDGRPGSGPFFHIPQDKSCQLPVI